MRKEWGKVKVEVKKWYRDHPEVDKLFPVIKRQRNTVRLLKPVAYSPEELEEREEWANSRFWKDIRKSLPAPDYNILFSRYYWNTPVKNIAKRKKVTPQWIYQKLRSIKQRLKGLPLIQGYVDKIRHIPYKRSLPPSLLWRGEVDQSFCLGVYEGSGGYWTDEIDEQSRIYGQKWKHFEVLRLHPLGNYREAGL